MLLQDSSITYRTAAPSQAGQKGRIANEELQTCMAWYSGAGKCCQSEAYSWLVPLGIRLMRLRTRITYMLIRATWRPRGSMKLLISPIFLASHLVAQQGLEVCWQKVPCIAIAIGERHRVRSWCKVMPLIYVAPTPPNPWSCFLFLFAVCALHLLSCLLLLVSLLSIQSLKHQSKNFTRSNAVPLLLTTGLSGIYIQRGCPIGYNELLAIYSDCLGGICVTFILPEQHNRQSWINHRL
jgi:hypothetical protein